MNNPGEPIIGTGTFPGSAFSEEPAVRKADYDALRAQVAAPFSLASGQPPVMTDDARALLVRDLMDEADLCQNDGAKDIALLLERAAAALQSQSSRELAVAEAVREATAKCCDDLDAHCLAIGRENCGERHGAQQLSKVIRALDLPALLAGMKEK